MFDGETFGQEIVSATKAHVDKVVSPLLARIAELETALTASVEQTNNVRKGMNDFRAFVMPAITSIPEPKEFDPEPIRLIAQEIIDARLAAFPVPENGKDGINGEPGAPGEAGKDGIQGLPGKDADLTDLTAPDELGVMIARAVRFMAETPEMILAQHAGPAPQPVTINLPDIVMPEMKFPDVHFALPEQQVPVVNVTVPEQKKRRTETTVTAHDSEGRIKKFVQKEVD